jgi:ribosomal protein S18 acetylase RimI-like enzyme
MTSLTIRRALPADVDALVALEHRSFDTDRLSRRSFRRFLGSDTAACLVAADQEALVGYALLLFRRDTALARLYSIAVDPARRGAGIGAALIVVGAGLALWPV